MNADVRTGDLLRGARAPRAAAVNGLLLLMLCPFLTRQATVCASPGSFAATPQNEQGKEQSTSAQRGISGWVKDQSGAALAGARITLIDQQGASLITAMTNQDGLYTLGSLPPGTYTVTAESSGFEKQSRSGLALSGSKSLEVDFLLHREEAGEHGAGAAKAHSAGQSLGGFSYYDKPEYKAGSLDAAPHASGYSAAAEADSYDLILAYVQGEDAEVSPQQGRGLTPPGAREPSPSQAPAEAPAEAEQSEEGWNESQFFSHGSDLLLHDRFAPAMAVFERAIARYPDSAKLETGFGVALYAEGQYDRAVKALIRATELMPSDPRAYLLLGRAYNASTAENDEVISRLRHLVEIEPRNAQAHYYYALSLWKKKQGSGADVHQVEELLKSAVALDSQFADPHIGLGALYAEQARYPLAIDEYQAAIRLKPDLPRTHYRLAQVYLRTGDKAAAQVELDAYEKLRSTQPDTRP